MRIAGIILFSLCLAMPLSSGSQFTPSVGDTLTFETTKKTGRVDWLSGSPGRIIENETVNGFANFTITEISETEVKAFLSIDSAPVKYEGDVNFDFDSPISYITKDKERTILVSGKDGSTCPQLDEAFGIYTLYPVDALQNDCLTGWILAYQHDLVHTMGVDFAERIDPSSYVFSPNSSSIRMELSLYLKNVDPSLENQIPEDLSNLFVNLSFSIVVARENFTYGFLYRQQVIPEFDIKELLNEEIPMSVINTHLRNMTFGLIFDKDTGVLWESVTDYESWRSSSTRKVLERTTWNFHVLQQGKESVIHDFSSLIPTVSRSLEIHAPTILFSILLVVVIRRKFYTSR